MYLRCQGINQEIHNGYHSLQKQKKIINKDRNLRIFIILIRFLHKMNLNLITKDQLVHQIVQDLH